MIISFSVRNICEIERRKQSVISRDRKENMQVDIAWMKFTKKQKCRIACESSESVSDRAIFQFLTCKNSWNDNDWKC